MLDRRNGHHGKQHPIQSVNFHRTKLTAGTSKCLGVVQAEAEAMRAATIASFIVELEVDGEIKLNCGEQGRSRASAPRVPARAAPMIQLGPMMTSLKLKNRADVLFLRDTEWASAKISCTLKWIFLWSVV